MHQSIFGSLHLSDEMSIKNSTTFQPLCTYSASGTLFSIGIQFEGERLNNSFKINRFRARIYCFYGSITYGLVKKGIKFEKSPEPNGHEHILTITIQALNTNEYVDWNPEGTNENDNWEVFPEKDFVLDHGKILRSVINIQPVLIPDENQSAQSIPFIDEYLYIRNGNKIENKQNFIESIKSFLLINPHPNEEDVITEKERLKEVHDLIRKHSGIESEKRDDKDVDIYWTIEVLTNYFLKGRDLNCYQRDVKLLIQ